MRNFDRSIFVKYTEAFIVSALFISVGYLLNAQDPCFLENKLNISIFILSILTLFFGWGGLLPFIGIYGLSMAIFYDKFDTYQILKLTLLGLILYLFQYVWNTRIKEQKVKEEYLNQKLNENSNAFYTLKASYDQLEKAYITKPFSLKDSLKRIINITENNNKSQKEEFLKLLSQIYQIKKSMIAIYQNNKVIELYSSSKTSNFDENDPLIKKAIEEKEPVYINLDNESNRTKYLTVIPVEDKSQNKISILIIEDMLFTSFNKDTLLEISVIFTYFLQSLEEKSFMNAHDCNRPYLNNKFAFELCKLQYIQKAYNISSSVITFKSNNREFMGKLLSIIRENKRAIEIVQTLTIDNSNYAIIMLFPFSNTSSVKGFVKRLKVIIDDKNMIEHISSKEFSYKIGDIKQDKLENLLG